MLRLYDARTDSKMWVEPAGEQLRIQLVTPADEWRRRRVAIVVDSIRRVSEFNGTVATVVGEATTTAHDQPAIPSVDVLVADSDSDTLREPSIFVRVGSIQRDDEIANELDSDHSMPAAFRCLCMLTPYRHKLIVDESSLRSAQKLYSRLQSNVRQWRMQAGAPDTFKSVQGRRFEQDFRAAINDDLALDVGLSIAQQVIDHDMQPGEKLRLLLYFDTVFGFEFNEEE